MPPPTSTAWLADRAAACVAAGIPGERIAVDPGIGFGKTLTHNLADPRRSCALPRPAVAPAAWRFAQELHRAARPRRACPSDRLGGSLAAALGGACAGGAHILRVHDVGDTRQALAVHRASRRIDEASQRAGGVAGRRVTVVTVRAATGEDTGVPRCWVRRDGEDAEASCSAPTAFAAVPTPSR